jgi:hypothetical protein
MTDSLPNPCDDGLLGVSSPANDREAAVNPMQRRELISRRLIKPPAWMRGMNALMLTVEGCGVKPDVRI